MVLVTTPPGYGQPQPSGASNPATNTYTSPTNAATASTSYVFDAVLTLDHEQTLTKTRHPVQTSAAITSHAYIEPASLVLYVLMSDVTPQYVNANQTSAPYISQFTGNPSKSVSAYQQMLTLQMARIPLTVTTRLRTYNNMLIARLSPHEDSKTIQGARFRVEFDQVFIASTQVAPNSARPNDTGDTGLGTVNSQTPPATVDQQFNIDNAAPSTAQSGTAPDNLLSWLNAPTLTPVDQPTGVDVPGAGRYSSVNTNALQQLPAPR